MQDKTEICRGHFTHFNARSSPESDQCADIPLTDLTPLYSWSLP